MYLTVHAQTMQQLRNSESIVLTIDGLSNIKHQQVFNVMACNPLPYFVDRFEMGTIAESAKNLVKKVKEQKAILQNEIIAASGFIL